MTAFNNLKMLFKIGGALASLFIVVIVVGIVSYIGMNSIREGGDNIYSNYFVSYINLAEVERNLSAIYIAQKAHIIAPDDNFMKAQEKTIREAEQVAQNRMDSFELTLDPGEETEAFHVYKEVVTKLLAMNQKIIKLSADNDDVVADKISNSDYVTLYNQAFEISNKMLQTNVVGAQENSAVNETQFRNSGIMLAVAVMFAVAIIIGFWMLFKVSVVSVLNRLNEAMIEISGGNLDTDLEIATRNDEIGSMIATLQVFKDNMIEAEKASEAKRRAEETQRLRAENVEKLTLSFDTAVSSTLDVVAQSANDMEATADTLSTTANQAAQQVEIVARASNEANANVQSVSAATEELSASISEISAQVSQSTNISNQAVEDAQKTNQEVQQLAQAASRIGEVVSLITDIAEQTNLLALNATIEAARAGDAGKGFAVVASEVKNLANQTAKATDEISSQIGGIQSSTEIAVTAIKNISDTIEKINNITTSIAAAVEEQNVATNEIARSVEKAAEGTRDVNTNIEGVDRAAKETGTASSQVQKASIGLNSETFKLRKVVEEFLGSIRAA